MSLTVKICGLTTPETLDAALTAGADMVGFVFFEKSPRHISLEMARVLGGLTGEKAIRVALSADADDAMLAAIIAALKPRFLQLHGTEPPARVFDVRARFGLPVIKALGIAQAGDLGEIENYTGAADWILLDAKAPRSLDRPGGTGHAFDWGLLRGLKISKPWLLAGGLSPENVASAIAVTGAPGVDVSSGVETAPGVKDVAKIKAFVAGARSSGAMEKLGSQP